MKYIKVNISDSELINELSEFASKIVKEHYDPILGSKQNDYMIKKFQSVDAITSQIKECYHYYFVCDNSDTKVGFIGFYPREEDLYLSKLYLQKEYRCKGYSKDILKFLINEAKKYDKESIVLNVNKYNDNSIKVYEKLGFVRIMDEKNDIGNGYYMDDFVYQYTL